MKHFNLKNIFLSLCLFASISAFAAEPVEIDGICYNLSEGDATAEVTRGSYSGAVVIPASITSDGVTYSVKSIGEKAFASRKEVTSVTIPGSVASIGEYAFYGCYGLTAITIPEGVTSIGNNAFSYCKNLTSVTIPSTVTSIGDYAFYSCSVLPSITIPVGVTSIGHDTFNLCRNLTSITIPEGVTSIGSFAFYGCSSLASVNIPNTVTSIGKDAFSFCYNLGSITIPNGVTNIESYTFYNCTGLTSVNFPNSVTSIADYAFGHCSALASLNIPSSATNISGEAFTETAWYNDQPDGVVYIGTMAYTYKGTIDEYGLLVIKDGTTVIGESAFEGNLNLAGVVLPESLDTICSDAFAGCVAMVLIYNLSETPTKIAEDAFGSLIGSYTYLVVPDDAMELYAAHPVWGKFQIKGLSEVIDEPANSPFKPTDDEDAIDIAKVDALTVSEAYDLSGRRQNGMQRGMNIIRMSDGSVKKVLVK